MRWSPPVQNAHLPFFSLGPLPVSSTQPTSLEVRACSSTRSSSSTVCGRKALRTSGRSKAIRTVPCAPVDVRARWYVRSVRSSKPGTASQSAGSKISLTPSIALMPGIYRRSDGLYDRGLDLDPWGKVYGRRRGGRMHIKELADQAGVTVKAVRYYEGRGLVSPRRETNGYRTYDE